MKKKLLISYNTFGAGSQESEKYIKDLNTIFWHIDKNNLYNDVRVVISSVLNHDECDNDLKKYYGDKISIFRYNKRYPVQVSCNKTFISSCYEFNEEYQGYFYYSSGIWLPQIQNLFPRIIKRINSDEIGLIQLQVDEDGGFGCLRNRYREWKEIENQNEDNDFLIAVGDYCNFHTGIFHKSLKEFYGVPILDVYGKGGMEGGLSYTSYALRKKHIVLNNSMCHHTPQSDIILNNEKLNLNEHPDIPDWLLWGRKNDVFLNDTEGIDAGLGNYPEWYTVNDYPYVVLPHRKDKYDENYLSTDERLKYAVKRCYFTNKTELDYDKIEYVLM